MNFIISIIQSLFRHRWVILVGTAIVTLFVSYYTRHMRGCVKSKNQVFFDILYKKDFISLLC